MSARKQQSTEPQAAEAPITCAEQAAEVLGLAPDATTERFRICDSSPVLPG